MAEKFAGKRDEKVLWDGMKTVVVQLAVSDASHGSGGHFDLGQGNGI